jgi:hypothetical protein
MRITPTVLLAGAAVVGLTGLALAAAPEFHEMTVQGPAGAVAHVRYTGDVAPKVTFLQGPLRPAAFGVWAAPSPFAEMNRITALMDRQMAHMIYQARLLQQQSMGDPLSTAVFQDLPAGSASYSFVSTMSSNGACMRTMQITSSVHGGQPKVVSRTEGSCGSDTNKPATKQATSASPNLQTISYKPAHADEQSHRGI